MKKLFRIVMITVLCLVSLCPINSFALDSENIRLYDADFSENRIQEIFDLNPQDNILERASGLINSYNVAIAKNSTNSTYIDMVARVVCDGDVVKCGFKKIVLQKRASTSSSWVNSLTIDDLYSDSSAHTIGKTFSVPSGYQYRVVCTFYAKKSLLVTQKIEHTSNYVSFW